MFVATIPFKVALFAALTGHEYQAEGAEGAADATTTGCRCRLLRAPCDLILSLLFHGMSVMRCSRCIHANGGVTLLVLANASRFRSLGGVAICRSRNKCDMCGLLTTLQSQSRRLSDDPVTPGSHWTRKHRKAQRHENHVGAGVLSFTPDASFSARVDKRSAPQPPLLCRCFCGL